MLFNRDSIREHYAWIVICVLTSAGAAVWYIWRLAASPDPPSGGTPSGLALGVVGALIILFEMLLWVQKWRWIRRLFWRHRRFGRIRGWMAAHIWLGLLSVPVVLMHAGFSWSGNLASLLTTLLLLVVVSGVYGLWLQNRLPTVMRIQTRAETIYSHIDFVSGQYADSARALVQSVCGPGALLPAAPEQLSTSSHGTRSQVVESNVAEIRMIGAPRRWSSVRSHAVGTSSHGDIPRNRVPGSEPLAESFQTVVEPYLRYGTATRDGLCLADSQNASTYFDQLRSRLDSRTHLAVESLERWCDHRRQFDLQERHHQHLHGWLGVHLPLSIGLVVLLLVHIVTALRY